MSESIRAFDAVAGTYDDWYEHPQGRQIFDAELRAVNLHIPEEGIGLELGSGTGIFAEHLTGAERTIVCLDPSRAMLRKSAERGMASVLGVGDALPLRIGVIDFTYMVTVMEFLDEPVAILREIRETAKEGAGLTALFINSESAGGDLYRSIGSKGDPVFRHARLYSMTEVEAFLTVSGYSVTERAGTLTTTPMETKVGGEITEPTSQNGVILLRAYAS